MTLTIKDIVRAEANGIPRILLYQRMNKGWDKEKAITYPKGVRQSTDLDYLITPEQYQIAEKNGINRRNLIQRVNYYAWDIEDAITIPAVGRGYKREAKYADYLKIAESNGVSYKTFYNRVHTLGWTKERAASTPVMEKGKSRCIH